MPERKASKKMFTSLPLQIHKKAVCLNIKYNYTKLTGHWYTWITFSGRFCPPWSHTIDCVINQLYHSNYREILAASQTTGQFSYDKNVSRIFIALTDNQLF